MKNTMEFDNRKIILKSFVLKEIIDSKMEDLILLLTCGIKSSIKIRNVFNG